MKKKIMGIFGLCLLFTGLTIFVEASESSDKPWSFTLGANQANSYTNYREKTDRSYLYIAVNANKPDVRSWAQGPGGKEYNSPKTYCGSGKSAVIFVYIRD
ncbi:hypothetical protein [Vagococcus fluvialis]|uniref:hypothetical protein n=1 Tax=Vagococcus fluvialis TaxID=2738 RepID=UPI003788C24A